MATKLWDIDDVGLAGLTLTNMTATVNANGHYVFNYDGTPTGTVSINASPFSNGSGYYLLVIEMTGLGLGRFRGSFSNVRDIGSGAQGIDGVSQTIWVNEVNDSSVSHYFDYIRHFGDKIVKKWQIWFDSSSMLENVGFLISGGGVRQVNIRGGADQ